MGVFIYWSGLVRTGTKSIRLLVCVGSDRSVVGPGRNRLLGTGPFLMWLAAELSNSRSTEWYWNARTVRLLRTGPYQIKMVRTNKRTHLT
jgi:hypothetical protein